MNGTIKVVLFFAAAAILWANSKETPTPKGTEPALAESPQIVPPLAIKNDPPPKASYLEALKTATTQVNSFKASDYTSDYKSVTIGFALFNAWAGVANDAPASPTREEKEARKKFLILMSTKQRSVFPSLRDAFGTAMRRYLWETDGKARTFGNGFRTIEFISATFAANRNIKSTHQTWYENLYRMRFTRAQYKWIDADVEYTYYTLTPPSDGKVGTWQGTSFVEVE